jgi:uncharacterized linocin/CFP29 family protein
MDHLARELAPVSSTAWREIESETSRALRNFLAARKLIDVSEPLGWETSAAEIGAVAPLDSSPVAGVEAGVRVVQPLVELRSRFSLRRSELNAIDLGSKSPDLSSVLDAARRAALAEDDIVFGGYPAVGIEGIAASSPHKQIPIEEDYELFPRAVALAVATLREAGVDGPYGVALGPRCYTNVIETTQRGGYPVLEQLRLITDGSFVWAPALEGSIVMSTRGGDFELVCGEDLTIGFAGSDAESVHLFLEESMTFCAHAPEAAVVLAHSA